MLLLRILAIFEIYLEIQWFLVHKINSMVALRIAVFWFVLRDCLPKMQKIYQKEISVFKQLNV